MGVTTISKIHNKTLNTDREAPLQVSDLEDPAKVFHSLSVLVLSPGTQHPYPSEGLAVSLETAARDSIAGPELGVT